MVRMPVGSKVGAIRLLGVDSVRVVTLQAAILGQIIV